MYCIFFKKTSPSFADLYVGIAKFGKCCDVVLLGHMCKYIVLWQKSNHYFECLYMGIVDVDKINRYWSQMTIAWFTKHMIHNKHYIMLMFTSFTTYYFLHSQKLQENLYQLQNWFLSLEINIKLKLFLKSRHPLLSCSKLILFN
jgi:hypothetical protein